MSNLQDTRRNIGDLVPPKSVALAHALGECIILIALILVATISFILPFIALLAYTLLVIEWRILRNSWRDIASIGRKTVARLCLISLSTVCLYWMETRGLDGHTGPLYPAKYTADASTLTTMDTLNYGGGTLVISQETAGIGPTVLSYRNFNNEILWASSLHHAGHRVNDGYILEHVDLVEIQPGVLRDRLTIWFSDGVAHVYIWKCGAVSRFYLGS